jgi:hypothetical protein
MNLNNFVKKFAIGIPIWIAVAFLLNFLNQPTSFSGSGDGAGMVNNASIFQSNASYLIIGYFVFSSIIAASVCSRRWRIWFGFSAHLFLLASLTTAILPDVSANYKMTDKATMETMILLPSYLIFFTPWIITWSRFAKAGSVKK